MGNANDMTLTERIHDWTLGGVNFSDPEEGGLECFNHVSVNQRWLEAAIGAGVSLLSLAAGMKLLDPRDTLRPTAEVDPRRMTFTRRLLLALFTLVFGLELGYKFATRQVIYVLYPCHVNSALWIYLLCASPASRANQVVYRLVLHFSHGTLFGIFFPVAEALKMPFEQETYWIQHWLLIIIPAYTVFGEREAWPLPSRRVDVAWVLMSYGAWCAWHFVFMHAVSVLTLANVGHMLCAAFSDPFAGPYYRMIGLGHQFLAVWLSAIFVALLAVLSDVVRAVLPARDACVKKQD